MILVSAAYCTFGFAEYMCHVYVRADNLAGVAISDHEYLYRVAHNMLNKVRSVEHLVLLPWLSLPKIPNIQVTRKPSVKGL